MTATTPIWETLESPYVVGHTSGDIIDYACETCAKEFADSHKLTWYLGSTEDSESGYFAYAVPFSDGETDYPVACHCGQYLDVRLTDEGVAYMLINEFPGWLYTAHDIER